MMFPSCPFIAAREFATTARCAGLVDAPCHVLSHRIDIPASLFGAMITVVRSSRFGSGDILVDVENRQLRRLDAALRHDAETDAFCDAWTWIETPARPGPKVMVACSPLARCCHALPGRGFYGDLVSSFFAKRVRCELREWLCEWLAGPQLLTTDVCT